ncbi:MAG TPA: ATP-binding protein [Bryobacteraceae bacterium]|jgi:anti-sigma regulatory factor (Ser/Thr protein kinase)|nr:ATP-binding protein [Bryobacteraceae bacterium]
MSPRGRLQPDPVRNEWRAEVPATLEAIDRFCRAFQFWRADTCARLDSFSAELLIREALTNSVIHGCAGNRRKRISCILRVKPGRLLIAIQDGGGGFDWRSVWGRRSNASDTRGRGLEILNRYATSVRFSSAGNSVIVVKQF